MNLDAYFERIGLRGEPAVDRATLDAISMAHVCAIPFENLDVLLARGIDLDLAAVEAKLVGARRGGYCFEHNTLLLAALQQLGFDARPISARVRYQRPRDFTPPRTHIFVRVELGGESLLADVGVGGNSLTSTLRLAAVGEEQVTPHDTRRLVFEDGRYFHQIRIHGAWCDVCEFTLEEMPPIDREVANWFTSAHPASHFKSRLVASRAVADGGRLSIVNRDFTRRGGDGVASTRQLASPEDLLRVLDADFGLAFPADTRFPCPGLIWD